MKIATFNVNGIRSRLPNLLEWLQRESPDVVCLQELKAVDEAFPELAIRSAGYEAIWGAARDRLRLGAACLRAMAIRTAGISRRR
jgi:exodeoxyribonuclease-3